jgi:hypothetical protein
MKGAQPHSYVARDTGTSVAFWLVAAVGMLIVIDAVVRGDLARSLATASIAALVIWALAMVLFRPHVRYDDTHVVVTNIGRIHEIPWSRIVAVRQNLNLTILLDDGRRINAMGVTAPRDRGLISGTLTRGKLGLGSLEFHKTADAMRLLHDKAPHGESPIVSRWDLPALAIGAALVVIVVAVAIANAL